MSIVKKALKEFNREQEPVLLLYPETWKPLVKAAIAGGPDALKYKNEDRLDSFIKKGIISQTITTPRGSQEVVRQLLKNGLSNEQTETFLYNVKLYIENRSNAWWENAINPNDEPVEEPDMEMVRGTDCYDSNSCKVEEVETVFQRSFETSPSSSVFGKNFNSGNERVVKNGKVILLMGDVAPR